MRRLPGLAGCGAFWPRPQVLKFRCQPAGTLLGGITFRNVLVRYDRANQRVGFGPGGPGWGWTLLCTPRFGS